MSINPLAWSEIKAWAELMDNNLTPFDFQVIKRIDTAFLLEQQKKEK